MVLIKEFSIFSNLISCKKIESVDPCTSDILFLLNDEYDYAFAKIQNNEIIIENKHKSKIDNQ